MYMPGECFLLTVWRSLLCSAVRCVCISGCLFYILFIGCVLSCQFYNKIELNCHVWTTAEHYTINHRPQLARQWNKCVQHCPTSPSITEPITVLIAITTQHGAEFHGTYNQHDSAPPPTSLSHLEIGLRGPWELWPRHWGAVGPQTQPCLPLFSCKCFSFSVLVVRWTAAQFPVHILSRRVVVYVGRGWRQLLSVPRLLQSLPETTLVSHPTAARNNLLIGQRRPQRQSINQSKDF